MEMVGVHRHRSLLLHIGSDTRVRHGTCRTRQAVSCNYAVVLIMARRL